MLYNKNNLNVSKIVSKNDIKPVLATVAFFKDKTVATDSYRLIEISTPRGQDIEEYPNTDKNIIREIQDKPILIAAKEVAKIKIKKHKELPVLENAVLTENERTNGLLTTDLNTVQNVASLKNTDDFPDYEQIFPKEEPIISVNVNPKMLAEVLQVLSGINTGLRGLRLEIHGNDNKIVIKAEGKEQTGRGIVMPINLKNLK